MTLVYVIIGIIVLYLIFKPAKRVNTYSSGYVRTAPRIQPSWKTRIKSYDITGIEINDDFKLALSIIDGDGKSIFITGKAGTGKSTLLKYFRATTKKNIVVLAPTGLAAINVDGQTIHSFFKFPPTFIEANKIRPLRDKEVVKKLDIVVIDEVSMVRADLMDGIDLSLQLNRNNNLPFGGVQMVFIGDLFQLPPIVKDQELKEYFAEHYGSPYFFSAKVFNKINIHMLELNKIYRQTDNEFIGFLNQIREKKINGISLTKFNQRVKPNGEYDRNSYVTLTPTNAVANEINQEYLERINSQALMYYAHKEGKFEVNAYPTEEELKLKVGAQVILIKNDKDKRWVNGTICKISNLSSSQIFVNIEGHTCEVKRELWENIEYYFDREKNKIEERIIGSFEQYPLRLAWALTIHKSQGQTFSKVIVDMGNGAFAHGQTYVALSRCTSIEGLILRKPLEYKDIILDDTVYKAEEIFNKIN
ncbi:MAG: AAA family ATPase [Stygiobacter sp.]|nr:MAG: AAA family ATPase [Stygiobacter sp.]